MAVSGLLGDTVMCTPVMAETRRLFPDAHIVGLVNRLNHDLLEPSGWFDEFLVYDNSAFPWRPHNIKALRLLSRSIQEKQFDLAIILLGDDWAPMLYRAGIPWRIGPQEAYFAGLMTHAYSIGRRNAWGPTERLNALRCLGAGVDSVLPQVVVSEKARSGIRQRLRWDSLSTRQPLVVFHPFAASSSRTLPVEKIIRIVQGIIRESDAQVMLIGGGRYQELFKDGPLPKTKGIYNYVGQLSIQETCALIELADVVLTTDSGPMHLAGALGRPTVGLFRAIRPEYANMYPTVVPVFWDDGVQCLKGCWWESWSGCREIPCRQLVGISDETIIHAVTRQLQKVVQAC